MPSWISDKDKMVSQYLFTCHSFIIMIGANSVNSKAILAQRVVPRRTDIVFPSFILAWSIVDIPCMQFHK